MNCLRLFFLLSFLSIVLNNTYSCPLTEQQDKVREWSGLQGDLFNNLTLSGDNHQLKEQLEILNKEHAKLLQVNNLKGALKVSERMLSLSNSVADHHLQAVMRHQLAKDQIKNDELKKGADNLTIVLKHSELHKDFELSAHCYRGLSTIFFMLREGEKSLYYSQKVKEVLSRSTEKSSYDDELNLIVTEILSNKLQSALQRLKREERRIDRAKYPWQTARIYLFSSHVYFRQKKFNLALEYLKRIEPLYTVLDSLHPEMRLHSEVALSETYYELGRISLSKYYFDKNIKWAISAFDTGNLLDVYLLGSKINQSIADYKPAVDYLKHYIKLRDSTNKSLLEESIHATEIKYQTAVKERAIAEQKLLLSKKDVELHQKNQYLVIGMGMLILFLLVGLIIYLIYRNRHQSTELSVLKAQIHPHFLFNTLNNLYALSLEKSNQAPGVVLGLANILRYILYECNTKTADLTKEITMIREYIELEKIRYGNRLDVNFNPASKFDGYVIAPLLLLPLVENAYKHGVARLDGQCWINIDASIKDNKFKFKISNNKPFLEKPESIKVIYGNIGLLNIKKRLDILYPNRHLFKIIDDDEIFIVKLEVDAKVYEDCNKK